MHVDTLSCALCQPLQHSPSVDFPVGLMRFNVEMQQVRDAAKFNIHKCNIVPKWTCSNLTDCGKDGAKFNWCKSVIWTC